MDTNLICTWLLTLLSVCFCIGTGSALSTQQPGQWPPPSGGAGHHQPPHGTQGYNQQPNGTEGYHHQQPNGTEGYHQQPNGTEGYHHQQPNGTEGYHHQQPNGTEGYHHQQPNGTEGYHQPPHGTQGYHQQPSGSAGNHQPTEPMTGHEGSNGEPATEALFHQYTGETYVTDALPRQESVETAPTTTQQPDSGQSQADASYVTIDNPSNRSEDGRHMTGSPEVITTSKPDISDSKTTTKPAPKDTIGVSRITAENFQSVRDELDSDLAPSEIAKLDNKVLNSAENVRSLASNTFTPGQKVMLRNLVTGVIKRMILANNVDLKLIAAASGQLGGEVIDQLTGDQVEEVLKEGGQIGGLCKDDVTCAQNYARKLAASGIFKSKPELLSLASHIIGHLSPKALSEALEQVVPVDVTYITNTFQFAKLSREQAQLVFEKFKKSSESFVGATAADPVSEYNKIPPSLRGGILARDVTNISDAAVAGVYDVFSSTWVREEVDRAISQRLFVRSPPITTLLASKAKKSGLLSLPLSTVKNLLRDGQLSAKDITTNKITVCKITKDDIKKGIPPFYTPLGCVVAEACKETWGSIDATPSAIYTKYGTLAGCATTSELGRLTPDSSSKEFVLNVGYICRGSSSMSLGKLEKVAGVVSTYLGSPAGAEDLTNSDFITSISCVLPLVVSISEILGNLSAQQKQTVCTNLKCADMSKFDDENARVIMTFCLKNGGRLRGLACQGGRGGISVPYLSYLRATDIGDTGPVTCEQVRTAIDLLSHSVLNCKARKKILQCVRPNSESLNNATSLALFGALCEFYAESDWSDVSADKTCGLIDHIPGRFQTLDTLSDYRALQGGFSKIRCDDVGRSRCIEKIRWCSETPSTRKRRTTTTASLTCDDIVRLGQSVSSLPPDTISQLSDADFEACVSPLGQVPAFSASQWTTLATKAKQLWGAPNTWTIEQIAKAAGIVSGLTAAEIDTMVLGDLDAISAIGRHGLWDKDKLGKAFARIKVNLRKNDIKAFTEVDFKVMGDIACGATSADIRGLPSEVYCGAASNIGVLESCETTQLVEWAVHAKICYGSNVTSWMPAVIADIGAVLGGLGKVDIRKLSTDAVSMIRPYTIHSIPTENINGFTRAQLQAMDPTQANSFTQEQLDSLDPEKEELVRRKATDTRTGQGGKNKKNEDNGCDLPKASVVFMVAVTILSGTFPE